MNDEKLTDEQVEFIEKFTGFIYIKSRDFWGEADTGNDGSPILNLISLAELEKAVMDKAVEKGYKFISFDHYGDEVLCAIGNNLMDACMPAKGSNRFHALLNALMEVERR